MWRAVDGDVVDLEFWVCLLVTGGLAIGAATVALIVSAMLIRLGDRRDVPLLHSQLRLGRRPLIAIAVTAAIAIAAHGFGQPIGWQRATTVLVISAACWLLLRGVLVGELVLFNRLRMEVADNRRIRRARTQVTLLRRVIAVIVVMLGIAGALMTFPELHAFGASLFASAGIAGIVAGLAAQTTLANMFAGMQLVFTDAVRMDDVVVVEGEWGWIEEITLTYVIVHIWDERRLVLPTSYFTSKPFQNWTRNEARVLGSVILYLDYQTPVPLLREQARKVIEASPLWDRRDWVLQVVDTTEHAIVVRVLASAADGPSAWDLRCEIREELLIFLQQHCPKALPVRRVISRVDLGKELEPADADLADTDLADTHLADTDLIATELINAGLADLALDEWGGPVESPPAISIDLTPVERAAPTPVRRAELRRARHRSRGSREPSSL
jgi:small-conductance mechanosensitive channel